LKRQQTQKDFSDYRSGIIASTLISVNCKPSEAKKFTPDYFFPNLKKKGKGKKEAVGSKQIKDRLSFFYPKEEDKK